VTGDLVERLRAELDRLEAVARAAMDRESEWWWDRPESPAEEHIRAWRPEVVLRTIQAHRAILDRHKAVPGAEQPVCDVCGFLAWDDEQMYGDPYPCPDVRSIAAIYLPDTADHIHADAPGSRCVRCSSPDVAYAGVYLPDIETGDTA
jgi:hypothetical protein